MSEDATPDALATVEAAFAAGVLAATWLDLGAASRSYPTWLSVGDVTLPFSVLPPAAFAAVVVAGVGATYRRGGRVGRRRAAEATLAGLTVGTAGYAVYNLNVAEPGLFVAGVPPMVFGVVLALVVLARRGVAAAHRLSAT